MADEESNEEVTTDVDADTRDDTEAAKGDEEQIVRDTDSDTKDVDSRLDVIEDMLQRMNGSIQKLTDAQSVLVESGAIVDTEPMEPDDDGIKDNGIMDLSI